MTSYDDDTLTAIQAVLDRISSYQDGAPEGTVEEELRAGFDEAGVDVADGDVTKLAGAIEAEHGSVQATDVLS
ncbi:MAG: hypothetical protein WKF79_00930 [Nocardioides sp.]